MEKYADVIVPLALPGAFTYALPASLGAEVVAGSRVVVPFGPRKSYTAIVVRLHSQAPPAGVKIKEIAALVDAAPLLLPVQIDFWRWLSSYYMCTPGEVMKAALPAGLKLETETLVALGEGIDPAADFSPRERNLLALLSEEKGRSIDSLQRELGGSPLMPVVRKLLERKAVRVMESMSRSFKPRTEVHVRLAPRFRSAEAVAALRLPLAKAKAQTSLLNAYLSLSGAAAAFRLENLGLLAEVSRARLLETAATGPAALTELVRKGVLETYDFEVGRLCRRKGETLSPPRPLTVPQQMAASQIDDVFRKKEVCLLHGVTSSGKTEVYASLIERELSAGRQVLYLVPEIALTTQLTERLGRVFGDRMGVYHSKFPDAERVELWQRQLTSSAFPLILGVRSSLFLPFRKLGLVIVDEEHEPSYKQQDPAPRYHARDAAIVLARLCGAKVLLGTATPALETYHNAKSGKYGLVEMRERFGRVLLPEICIENIKELRRKKLMKTPFSPRLAEEVRRALDAGGQAILFQNRRGYAPVLECRTCGWTPRCRHCDVSLTFHAKERKLVCHYCGTVYDLPAQCPNCGDTELRDRGYGTEKIEAAARACFPEARTARLDLDTTRTRTAYERILSDFGRGATNLLIGTQMVTKGLDFDRVGVVGILNADQLMNQPDFRAYERAFQLMAQVAGRAGRRDRRGMVVLQTRSPESPVVQQVAAGDYAAFYTQQMTERRLFRYPPVCRLVYVYLKHRDEALVEAAARQLAASLRPHFGDSLLGPDRPAVGRVQSLFIRKIMLKVDESLPPSGVRRTLLAARAAILASPGCKTLSIYFDVDPV